jgi:REP element-mobilizing transposase RayT
MPYRPVAAVAGEYYHVYNRGAMRMVLFFQPAMYHLFLRLLIVYAEKCGIAIAAVCLMPNHFHLLIRIEEGGDVSAFMQRLCRTYSAIINKILKRSGTIFQGRFHMRHVANEQYFRALCRYIHLNPVQAGIVQRPELYEYSNYMECIGRRNLIKGDHEIIQSFFGGAVAYERFILEGLNNPRLVDLALSEALATMKTV